MSGLTYRAGNLFEAPPGSVLVHSCNGLGVWGAGIAAQMKARFPSAFEKYRLHCASTRWEQFRGVAQVSYCPPFWIASLPVSLRYGSRRDPAPAIIEATWVAVRSLLEPWSWGGEPRPTEFHSPRINAGLFGVPWEMTERVLRELTKQYDVSWTVWAP